MNPILRKLLTISKLYFYFLLLLINNSYEFLVKVFYGPIPAGKVRLRKVLLRYKTDPEEISRKEDFLLSPGTLIEPTSLDHPNWHVYCIDEDLVTFAYLKSSIDKYCIGNYPFMYEPVHADTVHVAQISHDDFIKLAKGFEQKNQPKTVLFTNTARCGSTLMAKMLNHPGKSICYGEPHCLANLAIMDNAEVLSPERMKSLVSAAISCLRVHTSKDEVCVLKTTSGEARLVKYCDDVPNLKHMFMFRKLGLPSVERVVRREEEVNWCLLNLIHLNPHLTRFISNLISMEREHILKCQARTIKELAAIVYASPLTFYQRNAAKYCHPIVYHHDIIGNTAETLESLFTAIDIPLDCIESAVACKSDDSQKDSFLSQDKLRHIMIPKTTSEEYCRLRHISKTLELEGSVFETEDDEKDRKFQ